MSTSVTLPKTYKAAAVVAPTKLELIEKPIPEVVNDQVLIKVEACGVCHSDSFTYYGGYPGLTFPRVPGHEVIGLVVKTGPSATRFKVGDRVGRGWHGYNCFTCDTCRSGFFIGCAKETVTGIHDDGGYQEYMLAPEHSLASVPAGLDPVAAASLMCAGVTTFHGLRKLKVAPPGIVVVQGIGGLGHLGIQFARRMGYYTIAVSRGSDKEELAKSLGAHLYLDTNKVDAVAEINKLGGAAVVMTTAGAAASSPFVNCLAQQGQLLALGAEFDKYDVNSVQLIGKSSSIVGHASGSAKDSEDTLKFAKYNDVAAQTEVFAFSDFQKAFDRMMSGKARFRVILKF